MQDPTPESEDRPDLNPSWTVPLDLPRPPPRLDAWLARQVEGLSRTRLQQYIQEQRVTVNGHQERPRYELQPGDRIELNLPEPAPYTAQPEAIPLEILYEDADFIAINKQPGLVVHPAPGHRSGTLVNALLYHCKDLQGIGGSLRPGIVHRLDRDTSGVMVAAKTEAALTHLQGQFKSRKTRKTYQAILIGHPDKPAGTIKTRIGRDPHHRKRMSCEVKQGREAITRYRVLNTFEGFARVELQIETGRTHQIRVHMNHLNCPVAGDPLYGGRRTAGAPEGPTPPRLMLHACELQILHPKSGEKMILQAALPNDMQGLLDALRPS